MLKFVFTLLSISIISNIGMAQGTVAPDLKSTQFKITMLPVGLSVEQKIGPKQSINLTGGIQLGYAYTDGYDGIIDYDFFTTPFIAGELRNYYKRNSVRKTLEQNSGNYFALAAGYSGRKMRGDFDIPHDVNSENSYFIGPVWGIQRNYKTGFHLNLSIGMGYVNGEYLDSGVTFISTGGIGIFFK